MVANRQSGPERAFSGAEQKGAERRNSEFWPMKEPDVPATSCTEQFGDRDRRAMAAEPGHQETGIVWAAAVGMG